MLACENITDVDLATLVRALSEVSGGHMTAPLRAVLSYAATRWAYPGSIAHAELVFRASGHYDVGMGPETGERIVEPLDAE